MNCPKCYGRGKILFKIHTFSDDGHRSEVWHETCPNCHGSGIVHCCEGDQEQPPSPVKEH